VSAIRRREFIAGLGSAATWPMVARAQQTERVRRIGVLMAGGETDPQVKGMLSGFMQGLAELGWTDDRNLRMDIRWEGDSVDRMRMFAKELVDPQPDVLLANSTPTTAALQRETRTIPIVFVSVSDPIGSGFIVGLPRPGGNVTCFMSWEPSMGGKWLQLLAEMAPGVKRVAALYNPDTAPYVTSNYLPSFEAAAGSLKVEPIAAPVRSDAEIETVITSLGREPRGGFIAMPDGFLQVHSEPIISLAARNNVPAVYGNATFVRDGGLLSYGADLGDIFRRAAPYVDRILGGAKPADLPVQLPIKFQMAMNLETAKALGLTIPETLLATADEVIQ
jgi:putative tryptophan/tyrosine transport system substrate-binding protein